MTAENQKPIAPGGKGPILLSPWLVALAALALYGCTLNHWVTFSSIPFASQITGWDWHPGPLPWRPNPQYPLFFILTLPLRWLPLGWRVIGLNALTATCAALTLAILARCVRLLPHNRTEDQRRRQTVRHALLSMRAAFLPAAFAVLLLAAQLTFWDNAVSGIGDMIDLLVFAFLILCLLEYRISPDERRLYLFSFVYGVGAANNWALVGFFPCFLLAMIWTKRFAFFQWGFTLRMAAWGALGLLLYGLIPMIGAVAGDGSFLELLYQKLAAQFVHLARMQKVYAVIAAVPTLIPLLFAAIKWPSSRGETAAGAHNLTRGLIRLLHIVFLALGVLMFFDVGSIPTPRNMGMGVLPELPGFLSFYFLAALSVGYFSGYVLLVFGKDHISRWSRATGIARVINAVVVLLLWVAAIGLPAMLLYRNYRHVRDLNNSVVADFSMEMAKAIPPPPAVVLADDPARLYLAMGASQSLGLSDQYAFVESRSLVHREYLQYLARRFPSFQKALGTLVDRLPEQITELQAGDLLAALSHDGTVYYLHPSFGGFFERVCMTPYRLGVNLHPYPTNVLDTLALKSGAIATNNDYWRSLENGPLAALPGLANRSQDAARIAAYYSHALDYWGVELQKMGTRRKLPSLLDDANVQFTNALRLNPSNLFARANQEVNAQLRKSPPAAPILGTSYLTAHFDKHWNVALSEFGPADSPDLDIQIGRFFAQHDDSMLAAPLFQRSLELAPGNTVSELDLINTYINLGLVNAALELIKRMRERSAGDPLELVGVEVQANLRRDDFAQADLLLSDAHRTNPKNDNFAAVAAEFYWIMGDKILREHKGDPAAENSAEKDAAVWFKKALSALDDQLQLLNARTAGTREISNVHRRRAELQMTLHDYPAAITTLTELVNQNPQDAVPLLSRAIAEQELGRLDAAKSDYQALEKMSQLPSSVVYFGLAQVAQKQNDKTAEIYYDKLYLQHAPANTLEFTNATRRLHELQGG